MSWRVGIVAFAVVILSVGGCKKAHERVEIAEWVTHDSGLVAPRPVGLSLESSPKVLRFVDKRLVRQPLTIEIRHTNDAPLETAEVRALAGAKVHYQVDLLGAYSGGTEYRLRAWRESDQGWIQLTAQQQREQGPPDFAEGWAVLAGARFER
jgi:hypothetical protein